MSNEIIEVGEATKSAITAAPSQSMVINENANLVREMVRYAMANGGSLEQIREFMQLQREYEADEARKAFAQDMARFKAKPLAIYKDKHVEFKTEKGRTAYDHATIGNVCEVLVSALAEFGFSHRWMTTQENGQVIVECILTHRLGHLESVRLQSAPDTSGGKNGIQSIISAQTYLQRHTLLAICGVATKDQEDDDGKKSEFDTSLADEWIAKVKAAPTDADVVKVWEVGSKVIEKARDVHAFNEFSNAVAKRRADFVKKL